MSAGEVPRDVTALLAEHGDDVVGLTLRLRTVLLDGHPQLVEGVRTGWHSINYRDPDAGFVCALFPMADHVQLVFERGATLPDPYRRLTGTGRQVRAGVHHRERRRPGDGPRVSRPRRRVRYRVAIPAAVTVRA